MEEKTVTINLNELGMPEFHNMHVPLSDDEYRMAVDMSSSDGQSIPVFVGSLIRAEYIRRQYKELQNHG